jgi:glycosyltransferase involved in cell wall biosynthesis
VAEPGVDAAGLAPGTAAGDALLCVGSVTPDKGHDVLLSALKTATDLSWRCACVGSLDRAPAFADRVRRRAWEGRLLDRVGFLGPRTGPELDRAYAAADLLVLPSRAETYGMVVAEALARGLPVLATEVGGVTEALGYGDDGTRPGLLVPPGDPAAFGAALRTWLGDAELRGRLRRAARERRASLRPWTATASDVAGVLARVATDAERVLAGAAP